MKRRGVSYIEATILIVVICSVFLSFNFFSNTGFVTVAYNNIGLFNVLQGTTYSCRGVITEEGCSLESEAALEACAVTEVAGTTMPQNTKLCLEAYRTADLANGAIAVPTPYAQASSAVGTKCSIPPSAAQMANLRTTAINNPQVANMIFGYFSSTDAALNSLYNFDKPDISSISQLECPGEIHNFSGMPPPNFCDADYTLQMPSDGTGRIGLIYNLFYVPSALGYCCYQGFCHPSMPGWVYCIRLVDNGGPLGLIPETLMQASSCRPACQLGRYLSGSGEWLAKTDCAGLYGQYGITGCCDDFVQEYSTWFSYEPNATADSSYGVCRAPGENPMCP